MSDRSQRLRPPQLPQRPRKREAFAGSGRLAGAGKQITRSERQQQSARSSAPESYDGGLQSARGASLDGVSEVSGMESPILEEALEASPRAVVPPISINPPGANAKPGNADVAADAVELARGGEVLLRRLADVGSANNELRRQLEAQSREINVLEEAGRNQQTLLRDFERHAEQLRAAGIGLPKIFGEGTDREAQLRAEFDEYKERSQREKDELQEQLRQREKEIGQREGERDEARTHVQELDSRLQQILETPERNQARVNALEMEVTLLRTRFAKEAAAREAAEQAASEANAKQAQLQNELDKSRGETRQLQRSLAEQAELVSFRQEICNDLQSRLKDQKVESEKRLVHERGKAEAVQRLEGILPRHLVMKALA